MLARVQFSNLLTAESVRMVAMGDLMFFRSHTLTVRSSLPDTTLSPTVNTADVTVLDRKEETHYWVGSRLEHVTEKSDFINGNKGMDADRRGFVSVFG